MVYSPSYSCFFLLSQVMFPDTRFAEWDINRNYRHDCLSVYYEACFPDDSLCKIPLDVPLREVLSTVGRVARVPVFHIMVRNEQSHCL